MGSLHMTPGLEATDTGDQSRSASSGRPGAQA